MTFSYVTGLDWLIGNTIVLGTLRQQHLQVRQVWLKSVTCTGRTAQPIFTLDGSIDAEGRDEVPLGSKTADFI
jgi:hypothetical protein